MSETIDPSEPLQKWEGLAQSIAASPAPVGAVDAMIVAKGQRNPYADEGFKARVKWLRENGSEFDFAAPNALGEIFAGVLRQAGLPARLIVIAEMIKAANKFADWRVSQERAP